MCRRIIGERSLAAIEKFEENNSETERERARFSCIIKMEKKGYIGYTRGRMAETDCGDKLGKRLSQHV